MNFKELGLRDELVNACKSLGWEFPTDIQQCSIPFALKGRDIIGKAETGGGKTGAFSLPILNVWLNTSKPVMFALILTPTRELAAQIQQQLILLSGDSGLKTTLLMGNEEMSSQIMELGKWESHIVIATPGRLVALLAACRAARNMLKTVRQLVIDEADRMLQLEFGADIETITKHLPKRNSIKNTEMLSKGDITFVRQTQLFSATFTPMIKKIAGFLLFQPQEVFIENALQIPKSLTQYCLVLKFADRGSALFALLRQHLARKINPLEELTESDDIRSAIVFVSTCKQTRPLANYLNKMGASAVYLHSQMSQTQRDAALDDFRAGAANILIATDIASRGIDVDHVKLVINYDLPQNPDWYKHRVGRTARVGRPGTSVTFVTEVNQPQYLGMERRLQLGSLPVHPALKLNKQDQVKSQMCFTEAKKEERKRAEQIDGNDDDYCYVAANFTTKRQKLDEKRKKNK